MLLIVYAILTGILCLLAAYSIGDPRMFDGEFLENADFDADGALLLLVSGFFLLAIVERVLFFTCVFFVSRFTYRAMRNLYTVGSTVPDVSPSGTIYWYFVPFANFVVPASAMYQLYKGSVEEAGQVHRSGLVSWWWTAWLLSLLASVVSNSQFTPTYVLGPAIASGMLLSGLAALLLRQLISRITTAQQGIMQSSAAQVFA